MSHLRSEDIEAFLRGEEPADLAAFRRHAAACAECARRLADEARIDDVLAGAAVTARTPARRLAATRWLPWAAAAAIVAVVVVVAAVRLRPNGPSPTVTVAPVPIDAPGADPSTTDPRAEQPAARTLAPNAMGAWTTIEPERLALGLSSTPSATTEQ